MRRAVMGAGLAVAAGLAGLWLAGAGEALLRWVAGAQHLAQDRLAGAVRALRAGQPGAVAGLMGICLAYGALHAVGPGHGKALIGGYGLARRVDFVRLAALALGASLAQAAVAVGLVYAVVGLLGLGRDAVTAAGAGWVTALGNAMVAGLGLWLLLRGAAGLRRLGAGQTHGHTHTHDHDHDCARAGCGHAHGPSLEAAAQVHSLRDAALLVAGIALRPCTGALFLLVLTWQFGIGGAGVAGAFAMGLGTALVTIAVAGLAVWSREGALAALPGAGLARALPLIEAVAGAVILAAALLLLWRGV